MTRINNIHKSYGKPFSVVAANTYSSNVLAASDIIENSLIISAPYDKETGDDIGLYSLIMTDSYGMPTRLTYAIKCGNGLEYENDVVKLNIDNKTIFEHNGYLYASLEKLVDNKTLSYKDGKIHANIENLDVASASNPGLAKLDNYTIKSNNGSIYVDTSSLDNASGSIKGITTGDNITVKASHGVLSVIGNGLEKSSNTNFGMSKVDNSTIFSSNGVVYTTHEALEQMTTQSGHHLAKVDNITLKKSNGTISLDQSTIPYASTSTYGKVKIDQNTLYFGNDGKVHPKSSESMMSYIYDYNEALDIIEERINQFDEILETGFNTTPEIYSLACNETTTTALATPEQYEEPINMPVQHVYVSLNIVTNCDFNISIKYDYNEPPIVELQDINYSNEIKKVGIEAIDFTWPSTGMKEKELILLFNAKNFYAENLGKTLNTKISITIEAAEDRNASKEIIYSIIRYNSKYKEDELLKEEETVEEPHMYVELPNESFWFAIINENEIVYYENIKNIKEKQHIEVFQKYKVNANAQPQKVLLRDIINSCDINYYGKYVDEDGNKYGFIQSKINKEKFSSSNMQETINNIAVFSSTIMQKVDDEELYYTIKYESMPVYYAAVDNTKVKLYPGMPSYINVYQINRDEDDPNFEQISYYIIKNTTNDEHYFYDEEDPLEINEHLTYSKIDAYYDAGNLPLIHYEIDANDTTKLVKPADETRECNICLETTTNNSIQVTYDGIINSNMSFNAYIMPNKCTGSGCDNVKAKATKITFSYYATDYELNFNGLTPQVTITDNTYDFTIPIKYKMSNGNENVFVNLGDPSQYSDNPTLFENIGYAFPLKLEIYDGENLIGRENINGINVAFSQNYNSYSYSFIYDSQTSDIHCKISTINDLYNISYETVALEYIGNNPTLNTQKLSVSYNPANKELTVSFIENYGVQIYSNEVSYVPSYAMVSYVKHDEREPSINVQYSYGITGHTISIMQEPNECFTNVAAFGYNMLVNNNIPTINDIQTNPKYSSYSHSDDNDFQNGSHTINISGTEMDYMVVSYNVSNDICSDLVSYFIIHKNRPIVNWNNVKHYYKRLNNSFDVYLSYSLYDIDDHALLYEVNKTNGNVTYHGHLNAQVEFENNDGHYEQTMQFGYVFNIAVQDSRIPTFEPVISSLDGNFNNIQYNGSIGDEYGMMYQNPIVLEFEIDSRYVSDSNADNDVICSTYNQSIIYNVNLNDYSDGFHIPNMIEYDSQNEKLMLRLYNDYTNGSTNGLDSYDVIKIHFYNKENVSKDHFYVCRKNETDISTPSYSFEDVTDLVDQMLAVPYYMLANNLKSLMLTNVQGILDYSVFNSLQRISLKYDTGAIPDPIVEKYITYDNVDGFWKFYNRDGTECTQTDFNSFIYKLRNGESNEILCEIRYQFENALRTSYVRTYIPNIKKYIGIYNEQYAGFNINCCYAIYDSLFTPFNFDIEIHDTKYNDDNVNLNKVIWYKFMCNPIGNTEVETRIKIWDYNYFLREDILILPYIEDINSNHPENLLFEYVENEYFSNVPLGLQISYLSNESYWCSQLPTYIYCRSQLLDSMFGINRYNQPFYAYFNIDLYNGAPTSYTLADASDNYEVFLYSYTDEYEFYWVSQEETPEQYKLCYVVLAYNGDYENHPHIYDIPNMIYNVNTYSIVQTPKQISDYNIQ